MCCCSGNANNYQLVGNNINFSTSPSPSPCTCTLGTGCSPGVCLHLWVEKIEINSSEYMRLIKAGSILLYRGMWLLPTFLLSAGCCGDSDMRRGKQEGPSAGNSIPWSCCLPGPWPGGEQWQSGQSQPSSLALGRHWTVTHHTWCVGTMTNKINKNTLLLYSFCGERVSEHFTDVMVWSLPRAGNSHYHHMRTMGSWRAGDQAVGHGTRSQTKCSSSDKFSWGGIRGKKMT